MKLNSIERALMNNPVRAAHQHHREAAWFHRLAWRCAHRPACPGSGLRAGVGSQVILDRLGAARVTAFDLDELMVDLARTRLRGRPVTLSVGDVCDIAQPAGSIDTVVDFGIIHHVPNWRDALAEIARVLRPDGALLFEEVPRHVLDTWAFRTFTVHPRENRFEAAEFAAELARHGQHDAARIEHHLGGTLFVGAARKRIWPTSTPNRGPRSRGSPIGVCCTASLTVTTSSSRRIMSAGPGCPAWSRLPQVSRHRFTGRIRSSSWASARPACWEPYLVHWRLRLSRFRVSIGRSH